MKFRNTDEAAHASGPRSDRASMSDSADRSFSHQPVHPPRLPDQWLLSSRHAQARPTLYAAPPTRHQKLTPASADKPSPAVSIVELQSRTCPEKKNKL